MTLEIRQDRKLIRSNGQSRRYLSMTIKAPPGEQQQERSPLNMALVIDRSGSMQHGKLQRAREAACYVIDQLQKRDRFSVVIYDNEVDILVPSMRATSEAREAAIRRIQGIEARTTTNLCEGWLRGCQQVAEYLKEEDIGRCFLLSDGLANEGITDPEMIARHAANLRERYVITSTFGIGSDFDEVLLSNMAIQGGGNFYFIESENDIPRFINQELGENLEIVARDVEIVLESDRLTDVESLNDFPVSRDNRGWRIILGNLCSGQEIAPLACVQPGPGSAGETVDIQISMHSRDDIMHTNAKTVTFTHARSEDIKHQERDVIVDRRVAGVYAARAKRRATALNRDYDFKGARDVIERCIERISRYAGHDKEINAIIAELKESIITVSHEMNALHRKRLYSSSYMTVRDRSSYGSSKRTSRGDGLLVSVGNNTFFAVTRQVAKEANKVWADAMGKQPFRIDVNRALADTSEAERTGILHPVDELKLVRREQNKFRDYAGRIILLHRSLHDNWFSHWHPNTQTAVVSLEDWQKISNIDISAFIAYEILLNGLHILSPQYDLLRIIHKETRGCLFDFCEDKRDMEIKLQTMDLCKECRGTLEAMYIDPEVVIAGCDMIREMATRRVVA